MTRPGRLADVPDPRPRHSSPPPLRPNALLTVAIITLLWIVALVVLLVFGHLLPVDDRWWRWVCVAGIALGLIGIGYFARSPFRR
ncbi:MAG: DUF2530 domain-containing protein [Streptosporangiales bacterium]|nr:DUF2530 domain-containing protein [Streptosporangiales bacterium]